jgi:hypothetical protein
MAHFLAEIQGQRGPASRLGSVSSGITATAASWAGGIRTELYVKDGVDWADVSMIPWHGNGEARVLYSGPVGEYAPESERELA